MEDNITEDDPINQGNHNRVIKKTLQFFPNPVNNRIQKTLSTARSRTYIWRNPINASRHATRPFGPCTPHNNTASNTTIVNFPLLENCLLTRETVVISGHSV